MPGAKREPAAARGPSPLRVPPKGSFLAHCVDALRATASEMRQNVAALPDAEKPAAAWFISLAEPRRPWLWPVWAYCDLLVRPRFAEAIGKAEADRLFSAWPDMARNQAILEMDFRRRRASKEAKQGPSPDYRDLTHLIIGAAYEEFVWKNGDSGTANSRHAAISNRLGLDDLGVIRRWEKGHFAKAATDDELAAYVYFSPQLDRLAEIGRLRSRGLNGNSFAETDA